MQVSSSIDFADYIVNASGESSELAGTPPEIPDPPAIPQLKFRVPSTPLLSTDNIINVIKPYEDIIDQLQMLLLWRRPRTFGLLVFFFEAILFFVYITNMTFIPFMVSLSLLSITSRFILYKYHDFIISNFFPPIEDRGNENETNRLFSLEEIAKFISVIGSRIHTFILGCKQKADDPTAFGQIIWICFLFCFFVIGVTVRTFPFLFLAFHLIFFVPGIIFHPIVHPYILPYLQRIMTTIAPKIKDE